MISSNFVEAAGFLIETGLASAGAVVVVTSSVVWAVVASTVVETSSVVATLEVTSTVVELSLESEVGTFSTSVLSVTGITLPTTAQKLKQTKTVTEKAANTKNA